MNVVEMLIDADAKHPKRIAVVGDAMTDIYVHGSFGPCQEACQKFMEQSRVSVPGGAANVQRSLENWRCHVALFSNSLHGIKPQKVRFIVDGKYVFRHDDDSMDCEAVLAERREWEFRYLERSEFDAVLISDYDKGFLTVDFIRQVIDLANARGVPVVADAKREPELYRGAIVKCNNKYFNKYRMRCHDIPTLVVTHAGTYNPAVYRYGNGYTMMCDRIVRCVNHVGAGDCFAAHLTLSLAHGFSLENAAAIAHSAGRVYVQFEHNRPPHPEEIRDDFNEKPLATNLREESASANLDAI